VPELILATEDPAPEVRQAAVGALGRIGLPTATDALLAALNDRNAAVQWEAERALERLKGIPTAELVAGLESTSPRTRAEAARKLGDSGNPRLVPRLLPLLGDDDFGVRQAAVAALARFRDDTSTAQLLGALSNDSPVVRAGVVAVLGTQGRRESLPALLALAEDPDPTLRAEVIRSLATIDPQAASSTIMAASSDPNAEVRIAAVDALGAVGSPEARDALQTLARDDSPQVRLRAITILGYSMKK
jgi:HEAT repeat protein